MRRKLKLNPAESKVMRCSRDGGLGAAGIVPNGETVDQVAKFRYLGVDIDAAKSMEAEVSHRVAENTKALGDISGLGSERTLFLQ